MKTLTLKEAYAKATKGPLLFDSYGKEFCFHEGNKAAIVAHEKDGGETVETTVAEVWATSGETDKYDAALLCHSFNVLPEVVEALLWAESMLAGKLETDNAIGRALKNSLTVKIP